MRSAALDLTCLEKQCCSHDLCGGRRANVRHICIMQAFYERPAGHVACCLPCLGMKRTPRVRQTYDHRLRDAIAATGNTDLFRDVSIPASTRRTWARGDVRPVVASVDVELEVYDLLEQVDKLRRRAREQAAIIGVLVRLLNLRGGKLDGDRVPDGASKSAVLRAIASATGLLSLGTALKIVGISSARYHAWRRNEEGCGLDDQPSCPKFFPRQLTREEVSTMRDFVEAETYRHIAVQNLAPLRAASWQALRVCKHLVQDDPPARLEAPPKAGVSRKAQSRPQSNAPQRVLANRRNRDPADDRDPNLPPSGHRQYSGGTASRHILRP